jgi:hypothetical protein
MYFRRIVPKRSRFMAFLGLFVWLWRFLLGCSLYIRFGAVSGGDVNSIVSNTVQKTSLCKANVKQCMRFVFLFLVQSYGVKSLLMWL